MYFNYDQLNNLANDLLTGCPVAKLLFNDLPENERNYVVNLMTELERAEAQTI